MAPRSGNVSGPPLIPESDQTTGGIRWSGEGRGGGGGQRNEEKEEACWADPSVRRS